MIKEGDKIPHVTLKKLGENGMEEIDFADYIAGRKVLVFAVPGAFTPTCAQKHLPGYINKADELKSKGVEEIICLAVNDPFVMAHWGKTAGATDRVTMMPDGNGELTRALGMELDVSGAGLGIRSQRYAMIVEDGTVTDLEVEPNPGELDVSSADACAARL